LLAAVMAGAAMFGSAVQASGGRAGSAHGPGRHSARHRPLNPPAQQRFRAEWDFEAITEADNAIDAKRILDAGIAACGAHLAKPGAVADVVTREFRLSGSGGQAATGAALRALRTAQERGYLTHWDRMVQGSQNEIARTRDSQQTSATRAGPGRGALLPPLPMSLPHGPRLMYEDKETKWRSLEF
jgi:hypothetical protein